MLTAVELVKRDAEREVATLSPVSQLSRSVSELNVERFGIASTLEEGSWPLSQPIAGPTVLEVVPGTPVAVTASGESGPRRLSFASPTEPGNGKQGIVEKSPIPEVGEKSVVYDLSPQEKENNVSAKRALTSTDRRFGQEMTNRVASRPPLAQTRSMSSLFPNTTAPQQTGPPQAMEVDNNTTTGPVQEPKKTTPKRKLDQQRPAPVDATTSAAPRPKAMSSTEVTRTQVRARTLKLRRGFMRQRAASFAELSLSRGSSPTMSLPIPSPRDGLLSSATSSARSSGGDSARGTGPTEPRLGSPLGVARLKKTSQDSGGHSNSPRQHMMAHNRPRLPGTHDDSDLDWQKSAMMEGGYDDDDFGSEFGGTLHHARSELNLFSNHQVRDLTQSDRIVARSNPFGSSTGDEDSRSGCDEYDDEDDMGLAATQEYVCTDDESEGDTDLQRGGSLADRLGSHVDDRDATGPGREVFATVSETSLLMPATDLTAVVSPGYQIHKKQKLCPGPTDHITSLSASMPVRKSSMPMPVFDDDNVDSKSECTPTQEADEKVYYAVLGEEDNPMPAPLLPDKTPDRRAAPSSPTDMTPAQKERFDNMVGQTATKLRLPTIGLSEKGVEYVTPSTVADLVSGKYKDTIKRFVIVDCRYPYEYNGGHIPNAINLLGENHGVEYFFKNRQRDKNLVIIFHCEFSANRGPKMCTAVRSYDRDVVNRMHWPRLSYPEIYIMKGGYKAYHAAHPDKCFPQNAYVPMLHVNHRAECKKMTHLFRRNSTIWKSQKSREIEEQNGGLGRARSQTVTALGLDDDEGITGSPSRDGDGGSSRGGGGGGGMRKSRSRLNLDSGTLAALSTMGRGSQPAPVRTSSLALMFSEEDHAEGAGVQQQQQQQQQQVVQVDVADDDDDDPIVEIPTVGLDESSPAARKLKKDTEGR